MTNVSSLGIDLRQLNGGITILNRMNVFISFLVIVGVITISIATEVCDRKLVHYPLSNLN